VFAEIRNLYSARDLLIAWTGRTLRGRYQQSVLGWLWAVVQPAASVAIFSIIFTRFVPVDTQGIPYPVFSYVAMVPWTFFSASLNDMAVSLVQNMTLVTKIYFPREVLPVAAMLARFMDFSIASILLLILMLFYGVWPDPRGWLYIPLILLVQFALILGLGLLSAAVNVFYRDIQPLLTLAIQILFYTSPIIYPISLVPERLRPFYLLNPMAGILGAYRATLLKGSSLDSSFALASALSLLFLVTGYWFFKKVEHLFADIV
jgi:lipopolysaccharide transport system permease protein